MTTSYKTKTTFLMLKIKRQREGEGKNRQSRKADERQCDGEPRLNDDSEDECNRVKT